MVYTSNMNMKLLYVASVPLAIIGIIVVAILLFVIFVICFLLCGYCQKEKSCDGHSSTKQIKKQGKTSDCYEMSKKINNNHTTSSTAQTLETNNHMTLSTSQTENQEKTNDFHLLPNQVNIFEQQEKNNCMTSSTTQTDEPKRKNDDSQSEAQIMTKKTRRETVEKYEAPQVKGKKPTGLHNLGNTCFMNAMLQNLAWCPKLKTELETAKLKKCCIMSKRVLKCLKNTSSEESRQFSVGNPSAILSAARQRNSIFEGNDQQDSFEMFNTIISAIREEMEALIQEKESNVHVEERIMQSRTGVRLFYGTFVTKNDFSSCEHVECAFQRFSSITVPIVMPEGRASNEENDKFNPNLNESLFEEMTGIERGLKLGLMKTETFGENVLSCSKCDEPKTTGECKRTVLILESPTILVIHIDRFEENGKGGFDKRCDKVTYPETLNIAEFSRQDMAVSEQTHQVRYNLFGVVAHSGNILSGHYVAYIKTSPRSSILWYEHIYKSWKDPEKCKEEIERELEELKQNAPAHQNCSNRNYKEPQIKEEDQLHGETEWFYVSDSTVKNCKIEDAIDNENAYVLMYEKI